MAEREIPQTLTREEREKIERRVDQLRALARSEATTIDERRAAAHALAGLLDRYDLRVVFSGVPASSPPRPEAPFASSTPPPYREESDFDPSTFRVGGFRKKKPAPQARRVEVEEVVEPPGPRKVEDVGAVARKITSARGRGFLRIASKYRGLCAHCGQPYNRSEFIYWHRQRGAWHEECFEDEFGDGT